MANCTVYSVHLEPYSVAVHAVLLHLAPVHTSWGRHIVMVMSTRLKLLRGGTSQKDNYYMIGEEETYFKTGQNRNKIVSEYLDVNYYI